MKLKSIFTIILLLFVGTQAALASSKSKVKEQVFKDLSNDCLHGKQLCFLKIAAMEEVLEMPYSEILEELAKRNGLNVNDLNNIIPVEDTISREALVDILVDHPEIYTQLDLSGQSFLKQLAASTELNQSIDDRLASINSASHFVSLTGSSEVESAEDSQPVASEPSTEEKKITTHKTAHSKNRKSTGRHAYAQWKKSLNHSKKARGSTLCY